LDEGLRRLPAPISPPHISRNVARSGDTDETPVRSGTSRPSGAISRRPTLARTLGERIGRASVHRACAATR
ncbi:hypothetical protein, partial [Rathayibacter iranicus]